MDIYVSAFLNRPVFNQSKERIGSVHDLVVNDIGKEHPRITGLIINRGINKQLVFIPEHDVFEFSTKHIKLNTDIVDLTPFERRDDEVLLNKEVYDKQIIDIDDRRLTRVNDLLLEQKNRSMYLKGVDVTFAGILRRLHLPTLQSFIKPNSVDWGDVQFLGDNDPVRFKIHYKNLETLHPVDIARIIFEGPGYKQGSHVLSSLKDPIAADIIEELSPKLQRNLIESMKLEDVADVIKQMSAHKAADLLVALGTDYAKKILPLLDAKSSERIQSLLSYPEYSTGAFMTIDFVAFPANNTIDQVFTKIRKIEHLPDFLLYFYILENEYSNKLVGVMSLYELYSHSLRSRVQSMMNKRVITAHPQDNIKESLKKMYRYNISALPVVSTENKLLGIVTFKDAVSVYLPRKWKLRFSHMYEGGNS